MSVELLQAGEGARRHMFPPASLCNAVLKHLHHNDKHQKSDTDNTSVHSNFLAGLTARRNRNESDAATGMNSSKGE